MAIGAIQAGLRVPDDLSVIGLDEIELARFMVPPLTTVRLSFDELASNGMCLLIDMLEGKEIDRYHIVIEPTLIERQSTVPANNLPSDTASTR